MNPESPAQADRRIVTVMFADISGFTSMSERMDPEEVTAIMNECFERLAVVIDRYGGTIDKFMGDCVMVLFGAPLAMEDALEVLAMMETARRSITKRKPVAMPVIP